MNLLFGIVAGLSTTGVTLLADSITEQTNIPIGLAFGLGAGACWIVWWVGRNFQALKDGQKMTNGRLDRIESYLGIKFLAKQKEDSTTI